MEKKFICTGAASIASLALAVVAHGQCPNACGPGTVAEAEGCVAVDGDRVNDGCNLAIPAFQTVAAPATVCGRGSTLAAGASRDTDWFLITPANLAAADLDDNGIVQVSSALESEFPGVTFVVALGDALCEAVAVIGQIGFSPGGCGAGDNAKVTIVIADHPNGVVVFVGTGNADGSAIVDGFPCTEGLNDYTVAISLPDSPPECAPGSGPCNEAHATPGCEDPDCCKIVCEANSFCCDVEWDADCVADAVAAGCAAILPPCPAGGALELTHSASQTITAFNSVACSPDGGLTTTENAFARSYNLAVIVPGTPIAVNCVAWGIETNSAGDTEVAATVNVYADTTGGTPVGDGPGAGLTLLGSAPLVIPADAAAEILTAVFAPPLVVAADTRMVVELDIPDTSAITGVWPGSNASGNTPPVPNGNYIRSVSCGLAAYGDLAGIGFPGMHLVNVVIADPAGAPCPWDCQVVPNGSVGINDLLDLLAQWGGAGACNFDGGVVGITDLLKLLANWGACP